MKIHPTRASARGFTLIELMIVVVIVGVLMMIAVPAYQDSMKKSRRADGMRALLELASRQERFFAQNSFYVDNEDDIKAKTGLDWCPDDPCKRDAEPFSSDGWYRLTVSDDPCDDSNRCYTLTATPTGDQLKAENKIKGTQCKTLNVNSLGERYATDHLDERYAPDKDPCF